MKRRIHMTLAPVVFLVALTGCPPADQTNDEWLRTAKTTYAAKDYRSTLAAVSQFIASNPADPQIANAYYLRGLCHARLNERPKAYADLKKVTQTSADRDIVGKAYVTLGTLYWEDAKWEAAGKAYGTAASRLTPEENLDTVLWRQGICYERSGQWSRSRQPFQTILTKMPNSKLASYARRRLSLRPNHFAVQAGAFSQESLASARTQELTGKGFPAAVRREIRNGTMLNIVVVGRYSTYEMALGQLQRVREFVPDAQIWP